MYQEPILLTGGAEACWGELVHFSLSPPWLHGRSQEVELGNYLPASVQSGLSCYSVLWELGEVEVLWGQSCQGHSQLLPSG